MQENSRNKRFQLRGQVIADRLEKTITVLVRRVYRHPVYKKTVYSTKKYLVHDEKNAAKINDRVLIMETRPLSARKHFRLVKVLKLFAQQAKLTENKRAGVNI